MHRGWRPELQGNGLQSALTMRKEASVKVWHEQQDFLQPSCKAFWPQNPATQKLQCKKAGLAFDSWSGQHHTSSAATGTPRSDGGHSTVPSTHHFLWQGRQHALLYGTWPMFRRQLSQTCCLNPEGAASRSHRTPRAPQRQPCCFAKQDKFRTSRPVSHLPWGLRRLSLDTRIFFWVPIYRNFARPATQNHWGSVSEALQEPSLHFPCLSLHQLVSTKRYSGDLATAPPLQRPECTVGALCRRLCLQQERFCASVSLMWGPIYIYMLPMLSVLQEPLPP